MQVMLSAWAFLVVVLCAGGCHGLLTSATIDANDNRKNNSIQTAIENQAGSWPQEIFNPALRNYPLADPKCKRQTYRVNTDSILPREEDDSTMDDIRSSWNEYFRPMMKKVFKTLDFVKVVDWRYEVWRRRRQRPEWRQRLQRRLERRAERQRDPQLEDDWGYALGGGMTGGHNNSELWDTQKWNTTIWPAGPPLVATDKLAEAKWVVYFNENGEAVHVGMVTPFIYWVDVGMVLSKFTHPESPVNPVIYHTVGNYKALHYRFFKVNPQANPNWKSFGGFLCDGDGTFKIKAWRNKGSRRNVKKAADMHLEEVGLPSKAPSIPRRFLR